MKLKSIAVAAAVMAGALCSGAPAFANDGGGAPAKHDKKEGLSAEKMLKNFTHHLNLTQAQQDKIGPILTTMVADLNGIWNDKTLGKEERAAKAKATRNAAFDLVAAELTAEQKPKFEQYRADKEAGKSPEKPKKEKEADHD